MKIAVVVGTRPEVIKMAPVIREIKKRGHALLVIHSNQHYSDNMDRVFFEELELQAPHYNLEVGSSLHGNQTGNILIKIEPILLDEKPDVVLVQGDTNTVLAAALGAAKLNIPLGHVEAGLRSYDRKMPEETNRVVTDHISNYAFAVTEIQKDILIGEGHCEDTVFVVGNTIVDSTFQALELNKNFDDFLKKYNLSPQGYFLATIHRSSNVDDPNQLKTVLESLKAVSEKYSFKILWPIHPRTKVALTKFDLKLPSGVVEASPTGYLEFLTLQKNARLILTDSGGVQEEACILGVPCVTLRENTERPETVTVGANVLVQKISVESTLEVVDQVLAGNKKWKNPFGDGKTSERIIDILEERVGRANG